MKQNHIQQMLRSDKNYRSAFVLAVAAPIVCAAAAALVLWGRESFGLFFLPCRIKQLTGFNCLSCGCTRATFALLKGNVAEAIWYNPLYIVLLGWIVYLYARVVISLFTLPYRPYRLRLDWKWGIAIGAVALAFTVIRNLPFYQAYFF